MLVHVLPSTGNISDRRTRPTRTESEKQTRAGETRTVARNNRLLNKTPVGWCQYGIKEELPRVETIRAYKEQRPYKDKRRLWRITCFFVDRDSRGMNVAGFALKAALTAIRKEGGGVVEAYPIKSVKNVPGKTARGRASFLWSGTASMFKQAGFKVVASLGKSRQLVRRTIA